MSGQTCNCRIIALPCLTSTFNICCLASVLFLQTTTESNKLMRLVPPLSAMFSSLVLVLLFPLQRLAPHGRLINNLSQPFCVHCQPVSLVHRLENSGAIFVCQHRLMLAARLFAQQDPLAIVDHRRSSGPQRHKPSVSHLRRMTGAALSHQNGFHMLS